MPGWLTANRPFLVFDFQALWRSGRQSWAPKCRKVKTNQMAVCVECPQYSYLCTSCLLPAFDDAQCHVPATEWYQLYLPCYLFSVSIFCFSSMSVRQAAQRRIGWFAHYRTSDVAKNLGRYLSCTRRTFQGNDFEWILMVKMETRHPIEGYFDSEFRAICNHCWVIAAWS